VMVSAKCRNAGTQELELEIETWKTPIKRAMVQEDVEVMACILEKVVMGVSMQFILYVRSDRAGYECCDESCTVGGCMDKEVCVRQRVTCAFGERAL
jgi:hypothetical protein